ncbi:hypothetical protein [Phycicoccus avicenniae]|uniref:hypothetical protein n=1 Tax=Phycicoccus avicenniae TaxID=2828860 RepID=UPI003D2CDB93
MSDEGDRGSSPRSPARRVKVLMSPESIEILRRAQEAEGSSTTEIIRRAVRSLSFDDPNLIVEEDVILFASREAERMLVELGDATDVLGSNDRATARRAFQFVLTIVIYAKLLDLQVSEDGISELLLTVLGTWGLVGAGLNVPKGAGVLFDRVWRDPEGDKDLG